MIWYAKKSEELQCRSNKQLNVECLGGRKPSEEGGRGETAERRRRDEERRDREAEGRREEAQRRYSRATQN